MYLGVEVLLPVHVYPFSLSQLWTTDSLPMIVTMIFKLFSWMCWVFYNYNNSAIEISLHLSYK